MRGLPPCFEKALYSAGDPVSWVHLPIGVGQVIAGNCAGQRANLYGTSQRPRQWNLGDVSPPVARSRILPSSSSQVPPIGAAAASTTSPRSADVCVLGNEQGDFWPCGSTPVRIGDAGVRVLVDELDAVAADIAGVTFLLIRARGGSLVDEDATVTSRSAGERRIISNPSTHAGPGLTE